MAINDSSIFLNSLLLLQLYIYHYCYLWLIVRNRFYFYFYFFLNGLSFCGRSLVPSLLMIQPYLRVSGKQSLARLVTQPEKERITAWASWKRLIPCTIYNERSEQFDSLQAALKRSYVSKCGWLFRKGEWVFHARVPVEAQWCMENWTCWSKSTEEWWKSWMSSWKMWKRTRLHTFSVQWACFKAGRRICPQFQCKSWRRSRRTWKH